MIRYSHIRLAPNQQQKLLRQLSNPRNRAAGARILNDESRKMKAIAEELADSELHRRPPDRRSSAQPGYHDSFEIVPARETGNKLRASVRNIHESAGWVENGTQRHDIPAKNANNLRFPFNGPKGRGRAGAPGQFAVTYGGDTGVWGGKVADHPGAGAHHIMRRARDRYRSQAKHILNR